MAATGSTWKRKGPANTIHVPDNLRPRTCQCGPRAVHDAGSCALCGKRIPVEVLLREGIAVDLELLDEAQVR